MARGLGPRATRLIVSLAVIIGLFGSIGVVAAEEPTPEPTATQDEVTGHDHSTHDHGNTGEDGPRNCEAVGLQIAPGLEHSNEHSDRCTHGPDPAPAGYDIAESVEPVAVESLGTASAALCDGDGTSGYRTQVLYARASNVTSRFAAYQASFRQWAADADTIYNNSAAKTGSTRHIRFVHDASCTISVTEVVLSTTGDDNFGNTVKELQAQGYNLSNRKYLVFMDARVLCGIGHIYADDRASSSNYNNGNAGPMFSRVDSGCWGGQVAAHEHMHNLGAIQKSAPHPSAASHCTDEYDVMCYVDGSGVTMQYVCSPQSTHEALFDCNNDDYFNTNPAAGSYLANYWNTANNRFLMAGGTTTPTITHDAQVVLVSPPASVTQGTTATVTVSVKNNGSASESISVALSELPGGFSQTQVVTVAAGATSSVPFSWATTLSTVTGAHTFTATATVAADSNAANNSGTATTTVQAPVLVSTVSVSGMTFTSTAISGGYQLTGTVSVQSGGAAVGDASVSVEYTDPNGAKVSQTASTNTSGVANFSRSVTASGTYTLTATTVTKTGYNYDATANAITSKSITIAAPATATMSVSNITLTSAATSTGYTLSGRVYIQTSGVAVSGASVAVTWTYPNGATATATATTNSSGYATFTKAVTATGTYALKVTNVTRSGSTYSAAGNTLTSKSITVGSTSTGSTMSISSITLAKTTLLTGYRLTSRVYVKSNGVAVSGASIAVQFSYPNGTKYSMTATTNSSGYATFSRSVSAKGTYTVVVTNVTKSGFTYNASGNAMTSMSLTIS